MDRALSSAVSEGTQELSPEAMALITAPPLVPMDLAASDLVFAHEPAKPADPLDPQLAQLIAINLATLSALDAGWTTAGFEQSSGLIADETRFLQRPYATFSFGAAFPS